MNEQGHIIRRQDIDPADTNWYGMAGAAADEVLIQVCGFN